MIDQGLAKAIAELDGTRRYQKTSSDDGVHGNGPYSYNPPEYYFETRARGFSTEVGLPSIPTIEGVSQMMPAEDRWPISRSWGYHDYSGGACGCVNYASVMSSRYGAPSGLSDFCRKGQMINYETHRAVFEAWNHILWQDGSGTLLWMSNPAQPSFVWQLYDYNLEPNASFFGAKKAAEPLHIQLNLDDLSVYVINNTLGARENLRAEASIYDLDGKLKSSQSAPVSPAANEFTKCFDLAVPSSLSRVYFVKLVLRDARDRILSDNFYWRAIDKTNYTALDTLPRVDLTGEASSELGWDETTVRARIRNPSQTVAVAVRLKMTKKSSGARILPVFYEDNYFSLLPGESKDVQIRYFGWDLDGEQPELHIEGWNVNPGSVLIP